MSLSSFIVVGDCDRFKLKKNQKRIVSTSNIPKGTTILQNKWFARSTFVATSKEDYVAKGGSTSTEITFTEEESRALEGGVLIDSCFTGFGSAGHLQVMLELIEKNNSLCQKWVSDKEFLFNQQIPGMAVMSKFWHDKSLKWLETVRKMSKEDLAFWQEPVHFQYLYAIVTSNSFFLDLALSGTVIGVAFCPVLARFNHDCVPNAFIEKLPVGYRIVAATSIKKGEEICISYITEAIGLLTNDEVDTTLNYKFGFSCECPTHLETRPLYLKGVTQPLSLGVLCFKNKGLGQDLDTLNDAYRTQDFVLVRSVCYLLEKKWGSLIKKEPRLAYSVSSKYVNCVANVSPDGQADRWLQLYQDTLFRFCANPIYVLRSFFWFILETVRRFNIIEINKETGSIDYAFGGSHSKYVSVFLMSWLNLKRRLNFLLNSESLLFLEGCMFTGLTKYMDMMTPAFNSMVEFIESEDREAKEKNDAESKKKNGGGKNKNKNKKKALTSVKAPKKKENIIASTFVVERERVCVNTPYQVTAIDDRALNLYYFGEDVEPVVEEKAIHQTDEYLNGILKEDEVDELIRKNNPSFFPREKRDNHQSVATVSEAQKAIDKEYMKQPPKSKDSHVVTKTQKKKKKKTTTSATTTKAVLKEKNSSTVIENDDEELFMPIQIDFDESEFQ